MKCLNVLLPGLLLGIWAQAQSTDPGQLTFTGQISTITRSRTYLSGDVPTSVTYISYASTRTISTSSQAGQTNDTSVDRSTGSSTTLTRVLVGGSSTSSISSTSSSTSTTSSARPTNTQPCNNYPEFCTRKYSNITEIAAHNSPFVRRGNAASNQQLTVKYQLNDGIRMLQGQVHQQDDELYFCHTSCDLLNAGTVQDYLTTVYDWVVRHPYDVVTILLGNSDSVDATLFEDPITKSGLSRFAYTPPKIPMALDDWPTLSEMILTQKRVVFFLDYNANRTAVPYLLDEFSQLWETPFSPTDPSFPCTVQRPPNLSKAQARDRLYMANHNLNVDVKIGSLDLLIPNTADLNTTNSVDGGESSLGAAAKECRSDWGRAPNFLLVDYYNIPNGSVFEVAAQMNNVTYNRTCCGNGQTSGAGLSHNLPTSVLALSLLFVAWITF